MPEPPAEAEYPNQLNGWVQENDGSWSLYNAGVKMVGTAGNVVTLAGGGSLPTWFQSGSGSPYNSVTPSQKGALYQDTANGALYTATGATQADWKQIGGFIATLGATPVPGVAVETTGYVNLFSDLVHATGWLLTDTGAWVGSGNGLYWSHNAHVDGQQRLTLIVGAGGAFNHTWASDGSYSFPGALSGASWGVLADGAEYLTTVATPPDGDVPTSTRVQWFDNTTGKPVLRFKQKDAAGALTSGVSLGCTGHQTTVGAAGGASALPATPTEYLKVRDDAGNLFVIPAYAAS